VIAWMQADSGDEAFGPPPSGVDVRPWPEDPAAAADREDVEFALPGGDSRLAFDAMPGLRVVQVRSAGVDWIAGRVPPGVTLCSARGARDAAMAEWVAAAVLADAKRLRACADQQARRTWQHVTMRELAGLEVLVLGHGSIGRASARLLEPFGVRVRGVARHARPAEGVAALDELDALLPGADAVVNLLPLTQATRGLVGARALARMRDGALYVSAGRGATTDTGALLAELSAGRLRAVLDVVDPEPLPADHPLWDAPNLILTPHSAGDTPGADRAAWALAGEQLHRYARGDALLNVVGEGY
jgi:phosphoglycerate dehydrogenase-like enzyme